MFSLNAKARYGLLALVDLAENSTDDFIRAQDVADRKGIPPKYLGQILASLVQAGIAKGRRGSNGGYRLTVSPHALTVDRALLALGMDAPSERCIYDVLRATCTLPHRRGACDAVGPAQEAAMSVLTATTIADLCPGYPRAAPGYQI